MDEGDLVMDQNDSMDLHLEDYKVLETRLHGELLKICRRYTNELSIISLVGILDLVKQEVKDLNKTHLKFMQEDDMPDPPNSFTEPLDSDL